MNPCSRAKFVLVVLFLLPVAASAYVDEGTAPVVSFSPYKPTYLVVGKHEGKGQLSFKARPAAAIPLYLGYTQLMMWDIFKTSAPMRDINFNPDPFYRFQIGPDDDQRWIDLGPFEHESNGQGSGSSRSWNRSYVRYNSLIHFSDSDMRIQWSVKAWVPYSCEGGGCGKYRGVGELNVSLENLFGRFFGENDLSLRVYPGGPSTIDPTNGGQELTLRVRPSHKTFLPLLVAQFFHGFGENMLDQSAKQLAFRLGIGF